MDIEIRIIGKKEVPEELLLLGDESREHISGYFDSSIFFGAFSRGRIIGQLALNPEKGELGVDGEGRSGVCEVENLAVRPEYQGRKIGRRLLEAALSHAREKELRKVLIKTGAAGLGQLALYQKMGFEMIGIVRDYFVREYPEPIYENGIECRSRVDLEYHIYTEAETRAAVNAFREEFLQRFPEYAGREFEVWAFGMGEYQANYLLGLVRSGEKRGTSSSLDAYTPDEKVPEPGDLSIITYGNGMPASVLLTEDVRIAPFSEITPEEAVLEGEGDRSLAYWRDVHRRAFSIELEEAGLTFDENISVVYERVKSIFDILDLE